MVFKDKTTIEQMRLIQQLEKKTNNHLHLPTHREIAHQQEVQGVLSEECCYIINNKHSG
jgi:hypothetical protein